MANPEDRFEILEDASTECAHNFAVWVDLEKTIEDPNIHRETVQNVLLSGILAQWEKESKLSDLACEKITT